MDRSGDPASRTRYGNIGAQLDLRLSVLHWYEMTLSAGYAVGYRAGAHRRRVDGFAQDHVMAEFLRPVLALLPVASFLAVLVLLDSYKLVRLRTVVGVCLPACSPRASPMW